MFLTRLDVRGIRNITNASLRPATGINILYGENGSGKTSILEAIYLLGRGRTFRSRHSKTLISHDLKKCTVFGAAMDNAGSSAYTIGVSKELAGLFQFKVGGSRVLSAAALADAVPLLLMNSDSFLLIEGGPGGRRRFLDWGVFHVEPQFQGLWVQFRRSLLQRNKLLKHDKMTQQELRSWDDSFAGLSERLTALRQNYFDSVEGVFNKIIRQLTAVEGVKLSFFRGWEHEQELKDVLSDNYYRDVKRHSTSYGPHRADIRIQVDGRPVNDVLSRGQIKALVAALIIGQGQMLRSLTDKKCIFLLDDLVSELDSNYLERLVGLLSALQAQVFITGTEHSPLTKILSEEENTDVAVFHVEQGGVTFINDMF